MSDEELVKRLRGMDGDSMSIKTLDEAADSIEALTEQLEAARADAKEAEAYAEELEAKLAEAVEALKAIKLYSGCGDSRRQAITTLAEIEGEKG